MAILILCAAAIGGVSVSAGVGWHAEYHGNDSVFGFRASVGVRLNGDTAPFGVSAMTVVQGLSIAIENNDHEFPARWRRGMGSIGLGLQFDQGPIGLQLAVGPALATNRFPSGGGNDSGTALSATAWLSLWKWLRSELNFTRWVINAQNIGIGATTLSAGVGVGF